MRDMSIDTTHLFVRETVQTFIDNLIIESVQNAARRWHRPERREEGPLIYRDRPWEHVTYFTYSNYCVLRDPEDGLFKCWYEDLKPQAENYRGSPDPRWFLSRQCYAESEDGIHWRKPELDVLEVDGRKTNIVLGGGDLGVVHSMNVVIDPHPPTRAERFRAIFTHMWDGERGTYIRCAHSADGLHWEMYDDLPSFGMSGPHLADVSLMFYDEYAREFVQNTRHVMLVRGAALNLRNPHTHQSPRPYQPHSPTTDNKRRIWQSRSHDFIHWSEPLLIAAVDDVDDDLDDAFYGMSQFVLGNVHLATIGVFHSVENEMDAQLLVSRDGVRWRPTAKRQPFLAPRGEGHWDAHMVSMTSPPIEVGDEVWFYHGGTNYHHDWFFWGEAEGMDHPEVRDPLAGMWGLGLATLRKDGYAGLYSNRYREGIVVTRPLISVGTKLVINARCAPGGSVRVEVADRLDDVVEPCSKERSDPFTGDSVRHTVTWDGDPRIPVGPEAPNFRKLRFFLRDAELFSFQFADPAPAAGLR